MQLKIFRFLAFGLLSTLLTNFAVMGDRPIALRRPDQPRDTRYLALWSHEIFNPLRSMKSRLHPSVCHVSPTQYMAYGKCMGVEEHWRCSRMPMHLSYNEVAPLPFRTWDEYQPGIALHNCSWLPTAGAEQCSLPSLLLRHSIRIFVARHALSIPSILLKLPNCCLEHIFGRNLAELPSF